MMKKKLKNKLLETINRTELLFRPPCRKISLRRNPQHHEDPFKVAPSALKAKTTSRLKYLSHPKQETSECKALYAPKKPFKLSKGKVEISTRLIELSQPKPIPDDGVQFNKSEFKSKKQWKNHLKRLETISAPRRTPPSPLENKRVKTSLGKILPRLEELSKPAYRPPNINEKTFEEMSTIKPSVLKYIASERIKKLATVKQFTEDSEIKHKYNRQNAIKYEASERIKKLSEPVLRQVPKINELKDNPYEVDPKALKARCTPRLKKLARPIVRK